MRQARALLLLLIVAVIGAFILLDLPRFLDLEALRAAQDEINRFRDARPVAARALYFGLYVLMAGLSLPGAAVMTLAGGAIFGLLWGLALASFASSLGALLAFAVARFIGRDALQRRHSLRLRAINAGIERDGIFYLFALRLVPVFPFFVINLVMGLTPIRAWPFYWISQLGMLPGTLVYVNAGTQLGRLESAADVLSPALIGSFVLLGLFPLLARWILGWLRARRVYRGYRRPRQYDRNLIVIGGGSAGLVTAYIAAAVKAKVTLVERDRMGGDCLNTGCVPSKALIGTARLMERIRRAPHYGIASATASLDFRLAMQRVRQVIRQIEPHDSVERYRNLGVDVVQGEARIIDPWTVEIARNDSGTQRLTARSIVIATGAEPVVPPIPGLAEVDCLTSENLWELETLPGRLLVLGGGPIGCELGQAFARLGSRVTQVEMLPRLMAREDIEFSALMEQRFRNEGIDVRTGTKALRVEASSGQHALVVQGPEGEERIPFDRILLAVGRRPRLAGHGLEQLGIVEDDRLELDDYLRTRFPNIYACGDVAGPYQFTHAAAHMAWFCAVNALFGRWRKFRVDYSVIPWATFTEPEIARVGINEQEALERGIPYEVTTYGLDELDRAIADGEACGLIKVLTPPGKDRILGVTIAGAHAGELIAEFVLAMKHGLGLNRILGTIHVYPTMAESSKQVAGRWKQAHQPERLLRWVKKYHAWQRR